MPSGAHKRRELPICDFCAVHPKAVDTNAVDRTCIVHGVWATVRNATRICAAHGEITSWNPRHTVWRFARRSIDARDRWLEKRSGLLRRRWGIRDSRQRLNRQAAQTPDTGSRSKPECDDPRRGTERRQVHGSETGVSRLAWELCRT